MPQKIPVALQMYTVRDDAARDFAETIQTIAQIGYAGVELAGYGSVETPEAVRQILTDNGLFAVGAHVSLDALDADINKVISDAQILGYEYVVCPFLGENRRGSLEMYQATGKLLEGYGQILKNAGLQLCYHNHDFEFNKFGGDTFGYDALFAAAKPDLLMVEMDTFWVKKAGEDPAAYLRKYAGRVPLAHLKDMTTDGQFAEVGEGVINYTELLAAAEEAGVRFYVVEQDRCYNHAPLHSIRISFENLKKMGVV